MQRAVRFSLVMLLVLLLVPVNGTGETAAGSSVFFGRYEQDNDFSNGAEKIEWIVLDVADGKALLRSRFVLDVKPYNETWEDITWENCTLRSWLNNEFLNTAFTAEEQTAIQLTDVDNSQSQCFPDWDTVGGNNTQDRVFLLSYAEAGHYFDVARGDTNNMKARVSYTAYAAHNSSFNIAFEKTEDGQDAVWWWLRSPGFSQQGAADVFRNGALQSEKASRDHGGVCPVIWLDLGSLDQKP